MKEWMGADLSGLDIMAVQIDGIRISDPFTSLFTPATKVPSAARSLVFRTPCTPLL
jgi:hypothetical protein